MKKLITFSGILLLAAIAMNTGNTKEIEKARETEKTEVKTEGERGSALDELLSHPEVLKAAADNTLKNELQKRIREVSTIKDNYSHIKTMKSTKNGIIVGYDYNISKYGISESVASRIMEKIVRDEREKLEKYDWFNKLDRVRQEAVINLAFNLGVPGLLRFKGTIGYLDRGQYDRAARELLYTSRGSKTLYYRQVKGRAKEISEQLRTGVAKEPFLDTLKRHEGFRKYPYRDSRGIWTVGYGINLQHRGFDQKESLLLLAMGSIENRDILNDYNI